QYTSGPRAIAVRRATRQTPIFFLPTGLDDHSYVFALAKDVHIEHPVYALPWQACGGGPHTSIEKHAAKMVSLMQLVQPHSPYRRVGYSLGGLLAYAIAQQLLAIGETVSFVGLIDVPFPNPQWVKPPTGKELLQSHIQSLTADAAARQHLESLND